jgi:hypothetical protein
MGEGNPLQVAGEILEGSENQAAGQGGMGLIQGIGRKPDYAFLACEQGPFVFDGHQSVRPRRFSAGQIGQTVQMVCDARIVFDGQQRQQTLSDRLRTNRRSSLEASDTKAMPSLLRNPQFVCVGH